TLTRAQPTTGGGAIVTLDNDNKIKTDVIILNAGRQPHTNGVGLKAAGLQPGPRGAITVDEHCQAGPGRWAMSPASPCSPTSPTTRARVVADNILGRPRAASYHGIPRVVFADPEIAARRAHHRPGPRPRHR